MAKKQLTPEQYKEKMKKDAIKSESFSNTFLSAIAVLLAVVIAFSVVSTAYTFAGTVKKTTVTVDSDVQQNINNDSVIEDDSTPVTDDPVIMPDGNIDVPVEDNTENIPSADTETPDDSKEQEPAGAFASTAEMVAYFNECANKVKTDATKVVKNSERRIVGEIVVPDVLQSTAESLLNSNMKDDTEATIYDTKDEIKENFLVPNQDYVSCLKASDVVKADCKDNGKEYVIYFKLKDEKNPRAGSGVGSVCDVIETYEVAEKAPSFLEEFSTNYYDCEVTATIDKATGRMTHAVYSTPLKLNVVVSLFGTHSASVGLTFVKDYSITY